ncbi:MAG: DNA-binding protein [Prevotellaceae bacterium]|nr:DNA-binding protein [Candidatus Faecinaster equi]
MDKNKSLTKSQVSRQNILNNKFAMQDLQNEIGLQGVVFQNELKFSKKQIASYFNIEERTLGYYLVNHSTELTENGYKILKGKDLKDLIDAVNAQGLNEEWSIANKTPKLAVFNFRSFLNLAMLIPKNERAKQLRSLILDVSISAINKRTGGGTKYINSRDANYLQSAMNEQRYRKVLTRSISLYVEGNSTAKYRQITDKIYTAIFRENAAEYASILKINDIENIHDTMYAEVLMIIASFENGVGFAIQEQCVNTNHQLSIEEVYDIIDTFANSPMQVPYLEDARTKMASRDYCFRDAEHESIAEYISPVLSSDYEKFIGAHSDSLLQDLFQQRDVLKRLKQTEDAKN